MQGKSSSGLHFLRISIGGNASNPIRDAVRPELGNKGKTAESCAVQGYQSFCQNHRSGVLPIPLEDGYHSLHDRHFSVLPSQYVSLFPNKQTISTLN